MSAPSIDPFDLASGVPFVGGGIEGEISPKPKASIGLSKKVAAALMVLIVIVVVIFILSVDKVDEKGKAKTEEVKTKLPTSAVASNDIPTDLKDKRVTGSVLDVSAVSAPAAQSVVPGVSVPGASAVPGGVPAITGGRVELSPEEQRIARLKMEREQREMQAKQGGLEAKSFQGSGKKGYPLVDAARSRLDDAIAAATAGSGPGALTGAGNGQNQMGDQELKLKFLKEGGVAPDGYHKYTLAQPVSPYELKAGTFIPAVLEMAVNSDLPGLVTARVRENVYASVHDEYLLIPSMSKLVGSYDSRVALGQSRQLLVWNRLIYPDGSELNLAGMPATDVSGQSGLDADVDNHYLRLFGVTLGMSLVTAGVQLSVPQPSVSVNGQAAPPSNAQIVSASLAQQFGQLGGQIMGKYLNVQPTLRNYAGERFNIVVPRNIVFPGPWRSRGR